MAPRTPTDVNYAVLRRYLPRLHEILTIATYAHIYVWSSTSNSWSKAGFEGSLFLVSLNPPLPSPEDPIPKTEEYMLFLLNRYSLSNWHYKLRNPEDIDLESGEFCVLRANEPLKSENGASGNGNGNGNGSGAEEEMAYGLFIFSEPGTSTAEDKEKFLRMTKECATTFQATSAAAAAPTPIPQQEPQQQQAQTGRSISLLELFQQKDTQQPQEPLQHQQQLAQSQQGYYTQPGWRYQDIGSGGQQMAPQQLSPQHLAHQQWQQQQWQSQPQAPYEQPASVGAGAGALGGGGGDLLSLFQNAKYRDSSGQNHGY